MDIDDPKKLLVKIAEILDELNIEYVITGGMAILIWGRPRFTADIDVVVELKRNNIKKLAESLKLFDSTGYIDEDMMSEAFEKKGEFNFIHGPTGIKVDFWILGDDLSFQNELKREVVKKIDGQNINFISPEDLILSKLRWFQDSESTRHLEDIESILKISGDKLDMKYLKEWAKKQNFEDILNKILESK